MKEIEKVTEIDEKLSREISSIQRKLTKNDRTKTKLKKSLKELEIVLSGA